MFTSDAEVFRTRQAIADLHHVARSTKPATVRRIVAGLSRGGAGGTPPAMRVEWLFAGKSPLAALARDIEVRAAVMMTSALPNDDFDVFIAATVILLLERLELGDRPDNLFWNWAAHADHFRLADAPVRAAIMCGFREAQRLGRTALDGGPTATDCLTLSCTDVLAGLAADLADPAARRVQDDLRPALGGEIGAEAAGALWEEWAPTVLALPGPDAAPLAAAFRHLYERPASMRPSRPRLARTIPAGT